MMVAQSYSKNLGAPLFSSLDHVQFKQFQVTSYESSLCRNHASAVGQSPAVPTSVL